MRPVQVARALSVSRPSVTAMVKRLSEAGYVSYARYGRLNLTAQGRAVADRVKDRHRKLKRFLSLLGLDEATQENDIEGWEHCLSAATLNCLNDLTDFLEARPKLVESFRQRQRTPVKRARSARA